MCRPSLVIQLKDNSIRAGGSEGPFTTARARDTTASLRSKLPFWVYGLQLDICAPRLLRLRRPNAETAHFTAPAPVDDRPVASRRRCVCRLCVPRLAGQRGVSKMNISQSGQTITFPDPAIQRLMHFILAIGLWARCGFQTFPIRLMDHLQLPVICLIAGNLQHFAVSH